MIDHLLNSVVTVYRPTLTPDGRGGRSMAFLPIAGVRAKVNQPVGVEGVWSGQDGARLLTMVHVAWGTDVRRGDEIDTGSPRRLRVVDVINDSRRTYVRLDCEVVQGGA